MTTAVYPSTRVLCAMTLLMVGLCSAQRSPDQSGKPVHIPSSGGEVIATAAEKAVAYDQYHYAPARRVGDTLYLSGVVVGRRAEEGKDVAAFKAQVAGGSLFCLPACNVVYSRYLRQGHATRYA